MRDNFWSQIPEQYRYDLTNYGHWSGTGIVHLEDPRDGSYEFSSQILPTPKSNNDDWTLVTSYFNQTNMSSNLKHAHGCLSCPYNLMIYCDPESLEQLQKMRPSHLIDKTRYIVVNFDELKMIGHETDHNSNLTFKDYHMRIVQNRKDKPYQFDPKNNASYYLFCMSRYVLLKQTIETNPFNS